LPLLANPRTLSTQLDYNIFSVKAAEFDQGQRDPFGFDDISEKLGSKYLPFAVATKKPIYFFFVSYVNWLLENGKLNSKKKEETKLRLEKLLFLSWKQKHKDLNGTNVLGVSQKKVNPFRGNDGNWIIQTCFRIYGASVNKIIDQKFIDKYVADNPEEREILNEFLNKEGPLDRRNEIFLQSILKKLAKRKYSLFFDPQLTTKYKNIFKNYLREEIKARNLNYFNDIHSLFSPTNNLRERLFKKTIENEKKYPFKAFNDWCAAFILAVDSDIGGKNSKMNWQKADELFSKIPDVNKRGLSQRPEPRCWFERTGTKYTARQGNDFDQDGWNAVIKKAGKKNFYDFKHAALASLLKDLY
jgi:hypothetical protein